MNEDMKPEYCEVPHSSESQCTLGNGEASTRIVLQDSSLCIVQEERVRCPHCDRSLKNDRSLRTHVSNKHRDRIVTTAPRRGVQPRAVCVESGCDFRAVKTSDLRIHLQSCHGYTFPLERYQLDSWGAFRQWREQLEHDTDARFKAACIDNAQGVQHYMCNRSGIHRVVDEAERRRRARRSGTVATGRLCTAYLRARHQPDGRITVTCCLQHYGHGLDLDKIRLSSMDRKRLMDKVVTGVSFDAIMSGVRRCEAPERAPARTLLLNRQDLRNAAQRAGVFGVRSGGDIDADADDLLAPPSADDAVEARRVPSEEPADRYLPRKERLRQRMYSALGRISTLDTSAVGIWEQCLSAMEETAASSVAERANSLQAEADLLRAEAQFSCLLTVLPDRPTVAPPGAVLSERAGDGTDDGTDKPTAEPTAQVADTGGGELADQATGAGAGGTDVTVDELSSVVLDELEALDMGGQLGGAVMPEQPAAVSTGALAVPPAAGGDQGALADQQLAVTTQTATVGTAGASDRAGLWPAGEGAVRSARVVPDWNRSLGAEAAEECGKHSSENASDTMTEGGGRPSDGPRLTRPQGTTLDRTVGPTRRARRRCRPAGVFLPETRRRPAAEHAVGDSDVRHVVRCPSTTPVNSQPAVRFAVVSEGRIPERKLPMMFELAPDGSLPPFTLIFQETPS